MVNSETGVASCLFPNRRRRCLQLSPILCIIFSLSFGLTPRLALPIVLPFRWGGRHAARFVRWRDRPLHIPSAERGRMGLVRSVRSKNAISTLNRLPLFSSLSSSSRYE